MLVAGVERGSSALSLRIFNNVSDVLRGKDHNYMEEIKHS